jgi:hypothetical protein
LRRNKRSEETLNRLFMKYCTKACPNIKCGVPIVKVASGCTQIQCPKCFQSFCWACNAPAKGQKHYKEKPDHHSDEGTLLPESVTEEIINKHCNEDVSWINIKFCALCPQAGCGKINRKVGRANRLTCAECKKDFCYICNKAIKDGEDHYHADSQCREESDPFQDIS